MNKKQTYYYPIVIEKEINLDFEKIYKTVIENIGEEPDDYSIVGNEFGDNIDFYIEKIYGESMYPEGSDDYRILEYVEQTMDEIADDFWDYIEEKYKNKK